MAPTKPSFKTLLHSLPSELYIIIKDLTLQVEEATTIEVNKNWRPPAILQIDSATRKAFARIYYHTNLFNVDCHFGVDLKMPPHWRKAVSDHWGCRYNNDFGPELEDDILRADFKPPRGSCDAPRRVRRFPNVHEHSLHDLPIP